MADFPVGLMVVGHVAPEAAVGGTISLVQEGDMITIDAHPRSEVRGACVGSGVGGPEGQVGETSTSLYQRGVGAVCQVSFF